MKDDIIVVSAGVGRLHFIELCDSLKKAGSNMRLITGWNPSVFGLWAISLISKVIGNKNLAIRLSRRNCLFARLNFDVCYCSLAEFMGGVVGYVGHRGGSAQRYLMRFAWLAFGMSSRRYLKSGGIFHVRSGAGQGGAICDAKKRGMSVIVDHSIAHPSLIEELLNRESPGRSKSNISPNDPFWRLVIDDCNMADVLLVNSNFVRESFTANGYSRDKIRVVHLGVDRTFYSLKKTYDLNVTPVLLFTGSFTTRKGARYLVEAMVILKEMGYDTRLIVAGSYEECYHIAQESVVAKCIEFLGHLPQPKLLQLLATSDIYVFPTLAEGCAKSAMEALASGIPVITTPNCGLPGIPGEDYRQIPIQNAKLLAISIVELLQSRSLREKIGRSGARLITEKYTWEQTARNIQKIYAEI